MRQDVGHGDLFGHADRMPVRRAEDGRPQPDALGLRRPVRKLEERIRSDDVLVRVVLDRPGDLEAAFVRQLDQLEDLLREPVVRTARSCRSMWTAMPNFIDCLSSLGLLTGRLTRALGTAARSAC